MKYSPKLEESRKLDSNLMPRVSIIVPALNEEKYIGKCLQSLLGQDYQNVEIISIDDGSTDSTLLSMRSLASLDQRLRVLEAGQRPSGWVGKNWACFVGYSNSTGEILIFTDADTIHSEQAVTFAVKHMLQDNLSAITAIPKLSSNDLLTSVTLPLLSVFLQTRFSPLKVNDPANKLGYFFGSFFAIIREQYESIGTHREVRTEIIEDGAIGSLVKKRGIKMKMFRGENCIDALWARDRRGLWNGLLRLLVPMHREQGKKTVPVVIAIAFLMMFPFIALPTGIYFAYRQEYLLVGVSLAGAALSTLCVMTATSVLILSQSIKSRKRLVLGLSIGATMITTSFVVSLLRAHKPHSFAWKGRTYL
ncbi:MAG TPA: glycosyltransferase family 2 protein [Nitrososphaeraceae archaeon]|nr:glycosyltransferase family 2 protein [Nitrososphaeraceae archaeon]